MPTSSADTSLWCYDISEPVNVVADIVMERLLHSAASAICDVVSDLLRIICRIISSFESESRRHVGGEIKGQGEESALGG